MGKQQINTIKSGKMPPSAVDLEEAILGAMLLERNGLMLGMTALKNPDVFFKESHRFIFQAIANLFEISSPVDLLTISNELRRAGNLEIIGGPSYLVDLTSSVNSSDNMEYHIRIVKEMWIRRLIIEISAKNINAAYDDMTDTFELFDKSGRQMMKLQEELSNKKGSSGKEIYRNSLDQMAYWMNNPGITGISCGIPEIDDLTGGWQKNDLIVVAARPGMGKTAFAMSACVRPVIVDQHKHVLVFSFEMSKEQLMMRLISTESDYSLSKIRRGRISEQEFIDIQNKSQSLYNDFLKIEDSSMTVGELRAMAISHKMKFPDLELIVVDYLQLMISDGRGGNREQEISAISRALKLLAKELKIPVIALSQLSRSVETRGGEKRPMLSDLRESGAIEQDADIVIFLYRPEYYQIAEYSDGTSTVGKGDIIFAKHRNGPLDTITIGAEMSRLRYFSLRLESYKFPEPKETTVHPDKFTQSGNIDNFESQPLIKDEFKEKDDKAPF
jgi:replicative DNA helicase